MELSSGFFGSSPSVATVVTESFSRQAVYSVSRDNGSCFVGSFAKGSLPLRCVSPSGRKVITLTSSSSISLLTIGGGISTIETKLSSFQGVSWSRDELQVAFTAVAPVATTEYDMDHFEWKGDRGEGMQGFPKLFIWNLKDESPKELCCVDGNVFVTFPCFLDQDLYVVANPIPKHHPAGVKFCTNRPGFVARVNLEDGALTELPQTRGVGLSQLCCNGAKLLLWQCASSPFMHKSNCSIMGMDPAVARRPLAYISDLADLDFKAGSECVVFFTFARRCVHVVATLDLESGVVLEMQQENDVSGVLLDALHGQALIGLSSQWSGISIGVIDAKLHWRSFASPLIPPRFCANLRIVRCEEDDRVDIILIEPSSGGSTLCVYIHCLTTIWSSIVDSFLEAGFTVLAPNYAGSIGQPEPDRLLGNIGSVDITSVASCVRQARKEKHYERVCVFGGSHGGFIAAHMVARQEFDFVSAFAIRNPVVALDSIFHTSDIPDWTLVEGLNVESMDIDFTCLDGAKTEKLRSQSPLYACSQHVNRNIRVLIGLGGNDKRVPPQQGKLLYYCLKRNNVNVKLNFYSEEGHSIDGPNAEHWIRSVKKHFT